ncbi:hypothetical protein HO173_011318 [Letharia columbiana]|uniref:Uncharacterized protein n=1 Tax=Letharia columbiana TaxID=112416 RepID=A0A8H6FJJ2_9LECA|nr:uncharacterized protein HO173_011318 [Letharia columbiana]KAF6229672.1 hypothetical protein HO173_011318 [Letharia columbiana]
MGASIFNVISVFSAVIGFVGFMQNNLPHDPGPMDSAVRVAVALNGDKGEPGALRHAAGEAPLINAFNENQNWCGSSSDDDHQYITSGSFKDMTIWQSRHGGGPGEQATALQIIPTTNELCIAYIAQTWADGTHRGWTGDMGRGCDRDWYYSNIIVGDDHKPTCTWIDHDHSHGITTAALQIHMQDFTNLTSDYNHDPRSYCTWPTMLFRADAPGYKWTTTGQRTRVQKPKSIEFWDDADASRSAERPENDGVGRNGRRRNGRLARRSGSAAFSHLIASPHGGHSARELCASARSHGPDFLSFSEGIFCDMDAKVHWPLCDGATRDGCYHWDTHSLVLGDERLARNYSRVEEWE